MRSIHKLNKRICDAAQPKAKPYKLNDGNGLYLEVSPQGSKNWRYRYIIHGRENRVAIGPYPDVCHEQARQAHVELRKTVAKGIDPAAKRKEQRQLARQNPSQTFKEFALEWHSKQAPSWCTRHAQNIMARLIGDIFPQFGDVAIENVRASHVIDAIEKINDRGAYDIARRTLNYCSQIFDYAIGKDKININPASRRHSILVRRQVKHFASISYNELPNLLAKLNSYETSITLQTRLATKLLMLTFVRTKELTQAKWSEFNMDERQWIVPLDRMKKRRDHIVPLCTQALKILEQLKLMAGNSEYVFPSRSNPRKTMSENTILSGLKRMGYKGVMTGHGFRALAMTTIRERIRYPKDVIDLQLAHKVTDSSQPYDRSQFIEDRIRMMQSWADYLDNLIKPDTAC